jgi:hypothetical protein
MDNELLAIVRSRVARSRVKLRWRHMIGSYHPTTAFGKLHRSSPNLDQGPVRAECDETVVSLYGFRKFKPIL